MIAVQRLFMAISENFSGEDFYVRNKIQQLYKLQADGD